ncbi:general secretion pathway protein G [Rhizobiales bacterium GAS191]|nr:general secretion pathway protein G [Rhizobiales bacterium GAS191]
MKLILIDIKRFRTFASKCSNCRADERGMTLLEILVVMVILALLATLGALQLMNYLGRAKTDTARLQLQELSTALQVYRLDAGHPPTTSEGLNALLSKPADNSNWRGPYLNKPSNLIDPWGRPFGYKSPGDHGEFDLFSFGADGQPGGEGENADVTNWQDH